MAKHDVAVLDFGSGKLTLLVGHHSVNNNFSITAYSDIDYAGFMDGEFIEEDSLFDSIRQAVDEVSQALKQPLKKIYVGVPGEFCKIENVTLSKNYGKVVNLNKKRIDQLFYDADKNIMSSTHTVINISPIKYVLDDTNETYEPLDCYCKTIDVETCFVVADDKFISLVGRILSDLKIQEVEYVSSVLAAGQYVLTDSIRNDGALLVDVGYLTTSVAYFKGEGIVEMDCVSMGGAHITADLCEKLQIPFSVAEQVKQKLLVSVKPTGLDTYDVYKGNKIEKVQQMHKKEKVKQKVKSIKFNIKNTTKMYT